MRLWVSFEFSIINEKLFFHSWATPAQHLHVTKLKPKSTTVESEFDLKVYERNLQVR